MCSQCKCEHENKYIYDFEKKENQNKQINSIEEKIKKCEQILINEEEKYNKLVNDLNNQIKSLKIIFTEYKERNIKLISFYKLLINNYKQIYPIRNYNLINNIIINSNIDTTNSDDFVYKEKGYDKECISSQYNRLYNFYRIKNHVKTNQYSDYNITKKFCDKKIIKNCIFLNQDEIIFFFKDDHFLYHIKTIKNLIENEKNNKFYIKKSDNSDNIKDIYPLTNNRFISFDNKKILKLWEINERKITSKIMIDNFSYAIQDKFDLNNFFVIYNYESYNVVNYYIYNTNEFYLLYCSNKNFLIESLYETINENINKSEIDDEDKKLLLNLFKVDKNIKNKMPIILDNDNLLLKIIDEKYKKMYENLLKSIKNDKDKEKFIFNSNYIHFKILKEFNNNRNLKDNEINKIKYLLKFIQFCQEIRKNYLHYIAFYYINNIYNYNNDELIFFGNKYLFMNYSLQKSEFSHLITLNFLPEMNFTNFEIKYIYEDKIILNDVEKNIAYVIVIKSINNERILLIQNKYKYYNSLVAYKNYLIYNSSNNKNEFVIIDLNNLNQINHELKEFLNLKFDYNIPTFLFYDYNKCIFIYQDNQLCIFHCKILEENNNNIMGYIKINPIKIKNIKENWYQIKIPKFLVIPLIMTKVICLNFY